MTLSMRIAQAAADFFCGDYSTEQKCIPISHYSSHWHFFSSHFG